MRFHTQMMAAVRTGATIDDETALDILNSPAEDLPVIMASATEARRRFGDKVSLCSIINAKSGACGEDCAFCAQSGHRTEGRAKVYGLLAKKEMIEAYSAASERPIEFFSIVTSGGALSSEGIERICGTIRETRGTGAKWCASLGCLDRDLLKQLKEAGLVRYHHNLETARSYFPSVCTTHSYEKRLQTLREAKSAGLQVCCGGILGLGESLEQRVEFARILQREQVDSIPLNFLIPVPGTRLENMPLPAPLEILRSVAMFRLVNPQATLRLAAGRQHLLRLQGMLFYAGCNGMMVGDLLTVSNEDLQADLRMLADLEMEILPRSDAAISWNDKEFFEYKRK